MSNEDNAYTVNLADDTCTCVHWSYRLSKKEGSARRCKHIQIAREHLLNSIINDRKHYS